VPDPGPAPAGEPGGPGEWFPPLASPDRSAPDRPAADWPADGGPFPVPAEPATAGEALAMMLTGLGWLARADLTAAPAAVQAQCLRGLERARSVHAAAQARALAAFTACGGYELDGQGSPRTWLTWQTKITRPAASGHLAAMRRLHEHPAIAGALADAAISTSWGRQIAAWTDQLPAEHRAGADVILVAAARGGADLDGLAGLAEEIRNRTAAPDTDPGDGFEDRALRLATTLGGAGRLHGDLTPAAAAALQAVLDALGKRAGPEDTRSPVQRRHDALEEACRRLLADDCLPDRAGQPVRLQLQLSLDGLLNGAGHGPVPTGPAAPGPDIPAAGPGDDCDAAIAPIVTGHVDHDLLDTLAVRLTRPGGLWAETNPAAGTPAPGTPALCPACGTRPGQDQDLNRAAARELILANAIALLSGPGGLAAALRTGTLPDPAASISLPLDVGTVTDIVPPHLRRAIIMRDRHCAAPGCDQPPPACHVHHIIPRSQGGTTSLTNCLLLCSFHHLILIHRWNWTITLNADGTTTITSPDGRILRSHSPPAAA
jgi:Domain of unknown function (DUF222)/HNH endonuclease